MGSIKLGIVGDFDRDKHSHWATEAALFHAGAKLGLRIEPEWVPTPSLAEPNATRLLGRYAGIWAAPGSPYKSFQGMLNAIEYARTHELPFLGTCGGFQYALIELSRNVLGIADADSAENAPDGASVVISLVNGPVLACGARLQGESVLSLASDTRMSELCESNTLKGEFFCSFETNRDFVPRWQQVGMRVAATGESGELRAFELPSHRFFLATLFQPQLSSRFAAPHPIITGFLKAAETSR